MGFNICKRNIEINLNHWLSSFPDKEEAFRVCESLNSYAKKCTVKADGISFPK